MTWEWLVLGGLALVALGLLVALTRLRARTTRELDLARAEAEELRHRLDRLELERSRPVADEQEFRITSVGGLETGAVSSEQPEPVQLERAVFADLVLRESVIRLGSLAHGVRRALAPEARHRIRFEMKREVKRARKQRRAEMRAAHREWQARQREQLTDDDFKESA